VLSTPEIEFANWQNQLSARACSDRTHIELYSPYRLTLSMGISGQTHRSSCVLKSDPLSDQIRTSFIFIFLWCFGFGVGFMSTTWLRTWACLCCRLSERIRIRSLEVAGSQVWVSITIRAIPQVCSGVSWSNCPASNNSFPLGNHKS